MKKIMEAYRKGVLLNEKDLRFKFRPPSKEQDKAGPAPKDDFDDDGVADEFDDVPFDKRFSDVGTDPKQQADFLKMIDQAPSDSDNINTKVKSYYKTQGIDADNPDKAWKPDASRANIQSGDFWGKDQKVDAKMAKAYFDWQINSFKKESAFTNDAFNNQMNDGKLSVGEFVSWMASSKKTTKIDKIFDQIEGAIDKLAKDGSIANLTAAYGWTPASSAIKIVGSTSLVKKIAKHLSNQWADIGLRGMIGDAVGKALNGQVLGMGTGESGIDSLVPVLTNAIDKAADQVFPSAFGMRYAASWLLSWMFINGLKQGATDAAELAINTAIHKMVNPKKGLKIGKDAPKDFKEVFDIPDEIMDLLSSSQKKIKSDNETNLTLVREFFKRYHKEIAKQLEFWNNKLEAAKEGGERTVAWVDIWQQELEFDGAKVEKYQLAQKAVDVIRQAYGLKGMAVNLNVGTKEKPDNRIFKAGDIKESKRRRIVYRGKK